MKSASTASRFEMRNEADECLGASQQKRKVTPNDRHNRPNSAAVGSEPPKAAVLMEWLGSCYFLAGSSLLLSKSGNFVKK
jgi:hypothetical protein